MSDSMQQAKDDLSFLKQMAADDGMVLRASGIGLMVGGVVFFLVSLRHYLVSRQFIGWPEWLQPLVPMDGVLLFFVVLFTCFYLDGRGQHWGPPRTNAISRAMWVAWAAVGFGHLFTQIGMSQAGAGSLAVIPLFAFWGGGWAVVWAIYRHGALLLLALACYALAVLTGMFWEEEIKNALLLSGWLCLVAVPGFFVYRHACALQG